MLRSTMLIILSSFLFSVAFAGHIEVNATLTLMDGTTSNRTIMAPGSNNSINLWKAQNKGFYYEEEGKKIKITPKEYKRVVIGSGDNAIIFHSADVIQNGKYRPDFVHVVIDGNLMIGRHYNSPNSDSPESYPVLIKDMEGENADRIMGEMQFKDVKDFIPQCQAALEALESGEYNYYTLEAFGRFFNEQCKY